MSTAPGKRFVAESAEVDILARTIWGEARGEGEAGMIAVAAVVLNRVRISLAHDGRFWWGNSIETVCKARAQFSCWNPGDPNRAKLLSVGDRDAAFGIAKKVAADGAAGGLVDPTFDATTYKAAALPWPHNWGRPRLPLIEIGRLAFFNLLED